MPESKTAGHESVARMLAVAGAISLVCSVVVASAAVLLKPLQVQNETLNRQRNILQVAGLLDPAVSVDQAFERVESRVVDLDSGRFVTDVEAGFDPIAAARDAELGVEVPPQLDTANIGRRARYATVYIVREDDELALIVLPIYGAGLWSQIRGYVALEEDLNTVAGIAFSDHGETPGLGGEIDNPRWLALWPGKLAYGDGGQPAIEVIKGKVIERDGWSGASAAAAAYQVDGLSGATLTGDAVTNMLHYWLGEHGYRPMLQRMWRRGNRT